MIEARGLRKTFGQGAVVAVEDATFAAAPGEVTALLGPNGAGKTTLLRMLATVLEPDRGEARVNGFSLTAERREVRRSLGVLSDARGLYPRLTARENVEYYGALHGLSRPALAARVRALAEELEFGALLDRPTHGFSQGERMKVAIARALVHDPRTVLLDEPTNGLDVMSTRAMRRTIRQLRDAGKCVVLSSHVLAEVAAVSDRVVVASRGRVVASGTPGELQALAGKDSLEEAFVALVDAGGARG